MIEPYWKPKTPIIIREISKGKIWTVRPVTIIQDSASLIVFYIAPGTSFKHPKEIDSDNVPRHLVSSNWRLVDKTWKGGGAIYISKPHEPYMIIGFMNDGNSEVERWYINLQDPLRRTDLGFDYLDMELDVEINKDLSQWKWKDEDQFDELVSNGIIPLSKSIELRKIGQNIATSVINKESIIEKWKDWVPPFDLTIHNIPDNWNII